MLWMHLRQHACVHVYMLVCVWGCMCVCLPVVVGGCVSCACGERQEHCEVMRVHQRVWGRGMEGQGERAC